MPRIILASGNAKKIGELRELLAPDGYQLDGLDSVPDCPELIEDGDTFLANATIKACTVALHAGCFAIGEDSGLCVDALGGKPGLYSARYAGTHSDDEANNGKLVAALADVAAERRTAHYESTIVLCDPQGEVVATGAGQCYGRIVDEPRGTNGFGYDPHFLIREYHQTFGELPPVVKRAISHRARAMRQFLPRLRAAVGSGT